MTIPGTPTGEGRLVIENELADRINQALLNRTPIAVAYVGDDGFPHISFRGTTQVLAPDQLALWIRDPQGGLPKAIAKRPEVTLLYSDLPAKQIYTFYGRARVADDAATKAHVYDSSVPVEQEKDPERKGVAVIVDLDRVEGLDAGRRFVMKR